MVSVAFSPILGTPLNNTQPSPLGHRVHRPIQLLDPLPLLAGLAGPAVQRAKTFRRFVYRFPTPRNLGWRSWSWALLGGRARRREAWWTIPSLVTAAPRLLDSGAGARRERTGWTCAVLACARARLARPEVLPWILGAQPAWLLQAASAVAALALTALTELGRRCLLVAAGGDAVWSGNNSYRFSARVSPSATGRSAMSMRSSA